MQFYPKNISHFAVKLYLSINCSLRVKICVHDKGVSAAGKTRKERQKMRLWLLGSNWIAHMQGSWLKIGGT